MESLIYSSIFSSIQGEGLFSGKYSLFIRLAGCNLNCAFCDTKYAVDIKYFRDWKKESIEIIEEKISRLVKNKIKNLVITGGEPLIQSKPLKILIGNIKNYFNTIEIETNGTISGKTFFEDSVYFNVSVKLSNSMEREEKRIVPNIIKEFNNYEKTIFKFVVKDKNDIDEVMELKKRFKISNDRIYLMPMAKTSTELEERGKNILNLAIENGFNFSDRLQLRYNIQ